MSLNAVRAAARTTAAGLALAVAACGGSSPSGPSALSTPPPAPAFLDGWTEEAVAAEIVPSAPAIGAQVTVRAPGYLPREATFDGQPLYLWPQEEAYVRQTAYGIAGRLLRWTAPGFTVLLPEGVDPGADQVQIPLAEIAFRTGLAVIATADPKEQHDVVCAIDPADPGLTPGATGATYLMRTGSTIVGARLVFASRADLLGIRPAGRGNLLLHELGHAVGLGHVQVDGAVMQQFSSGQSQEFTHDEQISLKLMYRWRRPGNSPPDRDPSLTGGASAGGQRTIVVID